MNIEFAATDPSKAPTEEGHLSKVGFETGGYFLGQANVDIVIDGKRRRIAVADLVAAAAAFHVQATVGASLAGGLFGPHGTVIPPFPISPVVPK